MINLLQKTFFIFLMLVFSVFAAEKTPMDYLNDNTPLKPTKVFDNVYCIGSVSVVAWVIETSDGLILIDSMWDDRDAKLIEEGIKGFGLDPKDLKYIILSHGHGDHYGGANYLRNKYAAKVVLTKTDTDLMYNLNTGANSPRSPKTKVDIYSKDKDVIKLGDTSITILETPGHTAGCSSFIFPVKYKGKEYTAVLWGGTGLPKEKELVAKYKESAEYFKKEALSKNALVSLTAHLFADNGYANLEKVANLKEGEANPFIMTKAQMEKYLNSLIERAK
ncbi:MBL fold metallo-hydrolase [Brachyspira pilosicoli]|uniref:MBL fold metallo-hydrolase n=1 Tax=Brachyspira pilosicoli TaxID=52584 RepID=A0AAJ6KD79_BRAPL|nr:MBL fold metallo-hydrolase [Brachyspira pilosicoli]WIH81277.1 MBL fold metallo-hydrolase [Brachyspira pilosicoli]WIH85714.1 MBL fold metallo-hydrolase [Brachyspira pilosicoli]WIH87974.1 MBL fold metallo-hydrolase [Brachyspira pilosicoli]WIH90254.1 MBL fold metallo-hydrolase [Brachyspira pilosicoli]WIH92545.1 MBL fold metallo-hydrolase [Brachyspira pilosicoli]